MIEDGLSVTSATDGVTSGAEQAPDGQRRWLIWLLGFAGWTLVGLFFSIQIYLLFNVLDGRPFPWWRAITSTLPDWYIWALLSLFIIRLSQRFPLDREGWRRGLLRWLAGILTGRLLSGGTGCCI